MTFINSMLNTYDSLLTGIGLILSFVLIILLALKVLIRAYGDSRIKTWIRTLNIAIAPFLLALGIIITTAFIRGEMQERITGTPLYGTVETTTRLEDGLVSRRENEFMEEKFEITVPMKDETDIVISSKGLTFETITLPNEKTIDTLSKEPLDHTQSRAVEVGITRVYSIHFQTGKANLGPHSIPTVQNILEMMSEDPRIRIAIEGHTDSTGPSEINMKLSKLRAEVVASWLIQNGISSKRIVTKWHGDTRPITDNSTKEERWKNRRTEILILDTEY